MTGLDKLYDYAEQGKIFVYFGHVAFSPAVTIKDRDNFDIALDPRKIKNETEEKTVFMHELAHIATGAFYKDINDVYYRRKMENKASRWLIKLLIPKEELKEAIKNGYTETWDLADFFEISEDLMSEAIEYYKITTE